jgi:uncharacterized Fe-S radical SAM superfamily protein PflX
MDQYHPQYKAWDFEDLSRPPSTEEYRQAVELAKEFGLTQGETFRHADIINNLFR